jgi:serine/threonine-protein kinase RsbW
MDTSETRAFPGRFESLLTINEFVTRFAKAAGLNPKAIYDVQMAVDEACTNIIEHAYGGEGQGPIHCTCRVHEDTLTVVLGDYGCAFDPSSVPHPNLCANLNKRSSGGLGLFFMRQLMDQVHFESKPGLGNTLTLVKRRKPAIE